MFPEVRLERVVLANEPLLAGQAVVLRHELVVAAERMGVLNQLREHGASVSAGETVLEIVDVNLLAAIDKQLADEAERMETNQTQSPEAIAHLRAQLADAQAAVRAFATRYAGYLRMGDSRQAVRVFAELEVAHKRAHTRREEYTVAVGSQQQHATRLAELKNQRQQAILSVSTPLAGVLNFALDGREDELRADASHTLSLATFRQVTGTANALKNMDTIKAGQVVYSIIDPRSAVLLLPASSVTLGREVEVVFGSIAMAGSVLTQATNDGERGLVALHVTDPPVSMLIARVVRVAVQPRGETLTEIPMRAVLTREAGDMVYVQTAEGELKERNVQVRQRRGSVAVVSGLDVDELVVTNPSALVAERRRQ